MELKLDLPIAALAAPITEIMNTLTEDQKIAVAVQVVSGVLNNPTADAEFMGLDAQALAFVRKENYHYISQPDDELRKHKDYQRFLSIHVSGPRSKILQGMVNVGNDAMRAAITKAVLESPVTQATIKVVSDHIIAQIPTILARAFTLHFAGNLDRAITTEVMSRTLPGSNGDTPLLTQVELHKRVSEVVQTLTNNS